MGKLIDEHPDVARLITAVRTGAPVGSMASGAATTVDARCASCGRPRDGIRVADLVRRPRCHRCAPRRSAHGPALTLLEWARARAIAIGETPVSPCLECEAKGGPRARFPLPAWPQPQALVLDSLEGRATPRPTSPWGVLDRPCPHIADNAWGASLLADLVDLENADLPSASTEQIAWRCRRCDCRWSASPGDRTLRDRGCPDCAEAARRHSISAHRRAAGAAPTEAAVRISGALLAEFAGIVVTADGEVVTRRSRGVPEGPAVATRRAAGDQDPLPSTGPADPYDLPADWATDRLQPLVRPAVPADHDERLAAWICHACGFTWHAVVADRVAPDGDSGCPVARWTRTVADPDLYLGADDIWRMNLHAPDLNRAVWARAVTGEGVDVGEGVDDVDGAAAAWVATHPQPDGDTLADYPRRSDPGLRVEADLARHLRMRAAADRARSLQRQARVAFADSPLLVGTESRVPLAWAPFIAPAARAVAERHARARLGTLGASEVQAAALVHATRQRHQQRADQPAARALPSAPPAGAPLTPTRQAPYDRWARNQDALAQVLHRIDERNAELNRLLGERRHRTDEQV